MGCASSKIDDLPAVALCRERCTFLDEAIHHRYALAEAHVAYVHSLKAVGLSLSRFFDRDLDKFYGDPPSPLLNLPGQRKVDAVPSASPVPAAGHHHRHSHSNSGSHLHFHSDSDSDGDDSADESLHLHSDYGSPSHHHPHHRQPYGLVSYADQETLSSYPGGGFTVNMNYMRNQATPSVVYQQRPMSPETVHFGEASSSHYAYPYSNQNPSAYPYNNYPNNYSNNYGNYGGFFSSSSPPQVLSSSDAQESSSKPPPPHPSPTRGYTWDFLNPFDTFERYYPPYTPSRDSKEVREEEGIPDLEDEDFQQEVVKEVHGNQKFIDGGGGASDVAGDFSKAVAEEEGRKVSDSEAHFGTQPSSSIENDTVEYEVHMVGKKVVDAEEKSGSRGNVTAFKTRGGFSNDSEVVKEIQFQFFRASELGSELALILEVGKVPHNRKHAAYQVSSKMLNVTPLSIASTLPSTSKSAGSSSLEMADADGNVGTSSRGLSSTLRKLYLWEKKLYEEVKVEEKMRVLHERKSRKLIRLDERGAEAHKVDATRTLVRSLSTKIRIAIQVVDKISVHINNLRDEELWPQLNELIQGLTRMWRSMLECHHYQSQAIGAAKRLDAIASRKHLSDASLEATLQLEHELLNWTLRFSCWFGAQKGYIQSLNNWLLKCLLYIPEDTADGPVPFSPGRIGAPPIFVICHQWAQSFNRISDKEVVEAIRDFASNILQLWERDKLEMKRRMTMNKDMERKVKNLEREDQKIQKEIQVLDKRMVLASSGEGNFLSLTGQAVYQSETTKTGSLQTCLHRIFEAMERFAANSLKAYEELLQRVEEDRISRKQEKVS